MTKPITPERRAYLNKYNRRWLRERRQAWIDANGPCKKCGKWQRLEVDHIDSATKVAHAVWSWSEERRAAELAKCQVLCHKCHKEKSLAAITKPLVHGTVNGYHQKRCRCDACRAAWAAFKLSYVRRRRAAQTPTPTTPTTEGP